MIKFCPKCGGVMKPKKEGGRTVWVCTRCGHRLESAGQEGKLSISTRIEKSPRDQLIIIDAENNANLPITRDVTCPKCGNHEAYYWLLQTRAADEPSTRFYKCTRCGHVWREYE